MHQVRKHYRVYSSNLLLLLIAWSKLYDLSMIYKKKDKKKKKKEKKDG